jgi:hypothetical protein
MKIEFLTNLTVQICYSVLISQMNSREGAERNNGHINHFTGPRPLMSDYRVEW